MKLIAWKYPYLTACLTMIILYFEFQIRPQYLFSDLRRTYYNVMQSYQDFKNPDFYPNEEIKKVEEIAQRFLDYSPTIGNRVHFKFGEEAHNLAVGHCQGYEIVIDPHYWKRFTYWSREQLLFHELGHCLLGIAHSKGKITRNGREIASSVMDEDGMLLDGDYVLNRDYYLQELFSRVSDPLR